ncbi:MAG: hypothetical protein ACOC1T_01590 [Halorhodospira sp.]
MVDTLSPIREVEVQLTRISDAIAEAVVAASSDPGASPVLRAVFEELLRKSEATLTCMECEERFCCFRERIVELEQAADSAKAAAVADEGAGELTQERILVAHEALRDLKGVVRRGLRCCELLEQCCRS